MLRRVSLRLCAAAAAATTSSSSSSSSSSSVCQLRPKKWLDLHPIEKWTTILDTAANVNTLLDDDLWEKSSDSSSDKRTKKQLTPEEEQQRLQRGAPHVDLNRRKQLRDELRHLILHDLQLTRSDLAPTIVGLGFWLRSVMDTQETIARHHLPFAHTHRHLHALVATPLVGKLCRGIVDWNTAGMLVVGDDAAQQIKVEDMLPGTDLIDAASFCGGFSSSGSSTQKRSEGYKQLVLFPALRHVLEAVFAHVMSGLFIEGHAVRLMCGDRFVYLVVSLMFQHIVERNQCLDVMFLDSKSSNSSSNSNEEFSVKVDEQISRFSSSASIATVKKLLDPRVEMSSWVLPFTCPAFRADALGSSGSNGKEESITSPPKCSAILDRLASSCLLRQPNAVYYNEDAVGAEIAGEMAKRAHRLLDLVPELSGVANNSNSSNSIFHPRVPSFVPVPKLEERWPEHVHTPYVSLFGPKSWETSHLFRKQQVEDLIPVVGVRTTASNAAMAKRIGSGSAAGDSSNAAGRKRRAAAGLVDRTADVTFHGNHEGATRPRTAIGVNVDAKALLRGYPEMRTPCGAGNSFRYRSVARCILRRKFLDEYSWTGGPIGDPLVVLKEEKEGGDKNKNTKDEATSSSSSPSPSSSSSISVRYPPLLLQERTLEYFTSRAKPYESVPVIAARFGF